MRRIFKIMMMAVLAVALCGCRSKREAEKCVFTASGCEVTRTATVMSDSSLVRIVAQIDSPVIEVTVPGDSARRVRISGRRLHVDAGRTNRIQVKAETVDSAATLASGNAGRTIEIRPERGFGQWPWVVWLIAVIFIVRLIKRTRL